MKQNIKEYIMLTDKMIEDAEVTKDFREVHLNKISFYQHERLIHLLITLFFALLTFISLFLIKENFLYLLIFVILFICDFFYIMYYYFLENNVQYLYQQYDKIVKLTRK